MSAEETRELLHEVWLAVHVHRFDKRNGVTGRPDSFYAGVTEAEHLIGEVAARHGINGHSLRNPADGAR